MLATGVLALTLGACGAAARVADGVRVASTAPAQSGAPAVAETPCGAAAPATAAQAAGFAAQRIYKSELSSPEVSADRHQVESDGQLLSALAGNGSVGEAVTRLVYSGTHIVRLRVTRGGAVLADVGGPYIIAPVSGTLRLGGRTVGHYTLSVQDDLGYVKLESRFIGFPLIITQGGRRVPLEGTIAPGSTFIPTHGPLRYHGAGYETFSFAALAFPSGSLKVTVLVPRPASSTAGCARVRAIQLGQIAHTTWDRFARVEGPPSSFVKVAHGLTAGLIYIRSGAHQIAGSSRPGPGRLPDSGTVSYRGHTYEVTSFPAHIASGSVRIYQLVLP